MNKKRFSELGLGSRFSMFDREGVASMMKVSDREYLNEANGVIYDFLALAKSLDGEVFELPDLPAEAEAMSIAEELILNRILLREQQVENHRPEGQGRIGVLWPPFAVERYEQVTTHLEEIAQMLKEDRKAAHGDVSKSGRA